VRRSLSRTGVRLPELEERDEKTPRGRAETPRRHVLLV
jgi:hypothetical protein